MSLVFFSLAHIKTDKTFFECLPRRTVPLRSVDRIEIKFANVRTRELMPNTRQFKDLKRKKNTPDALYILVLYSFSSLSVERPPYHPSFDYPDPVAMHRVALYIISIVSCCTL